MSVIEFHIVCLLRGGVAVEVAGDIGSVPYEDLGVACNWLEDKDSVAGKNAVGGAGQWFSRHLSDSEAIGARVLEGSDGRVAVNDGEVIMKRVMG